MSKLTREHWIAAGLANLDETGHTGVSVERVARRLNVTRGSFYHHFKHRDEFVRALLSAWERGDAERMLAYAAQGRHAVEVLQRYLSIAGEQSPGREQAIRAWALQDPLAAEFQQRVDAARLAFAVQVSKPLSRVPGVAETLGRLAHLCLIGGQQSGMRRNAEQFNGWVTGALQLFAGGRAKRP
ncbi:TetR/AcrR family transcriptional regulator [Kerstersia sp.]|uniref:TetR/AcrR family transcriptional regulator n=1 Tax=Kerstersia sp. TaxID=1930783 RepID=UPI003F9006EB